jgi:hypothetical protein
MAPKVMSQKFQYTVNNKEYIVIWNWDSS